MDFEYDSTKSAKNKIKHGIDFVEAQVLWRDVRRLQLRAKTEDEARFLTIGKIKAKHWSAVFTFRGDKVRIISVRRARKEEEALYESENL